MVPTPPPTIRHASGTSHHNQNLELSARIFGFVLFVSLGAYLASGPRSTLITLYVSMLSRFLTYPHVCWTLILSCIQIQSCACQTGRILAIDSKLLGQASTHRAFMPLLLLFVYLVA